QREPRLPRQQVRQNFAMTSKFHDLCEESMWSLLLLRLPVPSCREQHLKARKQERTDNVGTYAGCLRVWPPTIISTNNVRSIMDGKPNNSQFAAQATKREDLSLQDELKAMRTQVDVVLHDGGTPAGYFKITPALRPTVILREKSIMSSDGWKDMLWARYSPPS
ncbi:hypothetical protein FOZ62_002949, partial [Perkinsus olseni]